MIYEIRIYRTLPGRLPNLLARFQNHTLRIWERHGIRQAGFWTTLAGKSNYDLTYLLAWESLAEREVKWPAFGADPEWLTVRAESEMDGQMSPIRVAPARRRFFAAACQRPDLRPRRALFRSNLSPPHDFASFADSAPRLKLMFARKTPRSLKCRLDAASCSSARARRAPNNLISIRVRKFLRTQARRRFLLGC